jgi:hypothetical protein
MLPLTTSELGENSLACKQCFCGDTMEATNAEQKIEELIRALGEEVTRLRAQRADISSRITRMSQIVLRLKRLYGSGTDSPSVGRGNRPGITRACRLVLMESRGRFLTIREVFRAIQAKLAPEMLAHKDPRASVATILGRLVEYGEVDIITDERGKRSYRWSDRDCVTRESYELVVPTRSHMDSDSDCGEEQMLNSDETL